MKSFAILVVLIASLSHAGEAPAVLPAVPATDVDSITSTELRMHLEFLASNELGGRYTLSPSLGVAARYLASHLKAYGFHGAGDHGDFLQHFDLVSSRPDPAKSSLALTVNGQTTKSGFGDFITLGGSGSGTAEGPIVFVGYGISSPSQKHDDYANLDVKGKIVLVASGLPEGVDRSRLGRDESGDAAAAAHGAIGVIAIPAQRMTDFMKNRNFKDFALRESVRLAKDIDNRVPVVILGAELVEKFLPSVGLSLKDIHEAEKKHLALAPKTLDASANIILVSDSSRVVAQNVVGVLEGTDPKLKHEYVVFSAHYDHLKTSDKGEIYPGADDDGSGTTAVLTSAHALALDPPKRSVLVVFHAGEELGLLGSEYNTDFSPAIPLEKIVADLNIDMIGRSKPLGDKESADEHLTDANTVYLVGSDRSSKELHKLSEQTNSDYQKLYLDYYYNDPANPERIYFRSDHWNYAKHGIPVIFYFDGTHVDYHKPTDTVNKIDFTKLTNVTRLVFETGWRIANLDHRLSRTTN